VLSHPAGPRARCRRQIAAARAPPLG
jgi:hypothetical protein